MKRDKQYMIEALPIHKEICSYLIDNKITFTCYNGGLKAIVIDTFHPYMTNDFINEIIKKFNLKLEKETENRVTYRQ